MEELLAILKVKLCNCTLQDESVREIREYIEEGSEALDLNHLHKYNFENSYKSHYNIHREFWALMDEAQKNKEKFTRILNVLFAIGGDSLFKIVYNRFYNLQATVDYLQYLPRKESLLAWVISKSKGDVKAVINILQDTLKPDGKTISRAFVASEDTYVKLIIGIIAAKNCYELPITIEEIIKNYFRNPFEKKAIESSLAPILQFLYYAHEERVEFKELIAKIINESGDRRNLFDQLVGFIKSYDSKADIYEFVKGFHIDKRIYVMRLIHLYIVDENKKALQDINMKIKDIPEVFRESIDCFERNHLIDYEKLWLAQIVYNYYGESSDLEKVVECTNEILGTFIFNINDLSPLSGEEKEKILQYVLEGKNKDVAYGYLSRIEKSQGENYLWIYQGKAFKWIYLLKETRSIIYRLIYVLAAMGRYDTAAGISDHIIGITELSYISFVIELLGEDVSEEDLVFVADAALNQYGCKNGLKFTEYLNKLCVEGNTNLIKNLELLNISTKEIVLEKLFNNDKKKYSPLLVKFLSDSSKVVRDKVIAMLSTYDYCRAQVLEQLKSKKTAVREAAARILINYDMRNFKDILQKSAHTEKNEKIKGLILNIINSDHLDEQTLQSAKNINYYCAERLKKIEYTAPTWLPLQNTQEIRYIDGAAISKEVIVYLVNKYSLENVVEKNSTAEKIIHRCNKYDLDIIGNEILNCWIKDGADTKKKWVLALVSALGGFNVINTLKNQIEVWSKSSRGAIASDAIKALALNGSNEALMVIDNIARRFKHKQIKKAAEEAFVFAASMLNLSDEELADIIIPDLGFNERGERVFEFGSRNFVAILESDFSLKVQDENGKFLKALPKPNKSDDEAKAKEASEEFKNMKKQIKTIVSTQSLRLEMALAVNRLWKKDSWERLFVKNPIMHNFSLSLVWGVYVDGELRDTFRYMEDGSFNTKDEEEFQLEDNSLIGLIHPIEMKEENLKLWRQQFEDYEIEQPFPQLSRKVYKVTEEEEDLQWIERFGGIKINGLSLVGKLSKFGWYRGSIQDAGGYYQFYKEDEKLGIGAEITFEWLSVGYEDEETTIYELKFYKAKTVKRGSYVYDEVSDENIILPSKVPAKFFSEILYEVALALEAKIGVAANWKKEKCY